MFVPLWLVLPRCDPTNLGVFGLCHFALLQRDCANSGGFQLELADVAYYIYKSREQKGISAGRLAGCFRVARLCRGSPDI